MATSSEVGTPSTQTAPKMGIVKQILGDGSVVIRGQPKGGPPPERQLSLSYVVVPRLARRPTDAFPTEIKDEPYAWEAREWMRKFLVGKQVQFKLEYTIPNTGREFGTLLVKINGTVCNVADKLVSEGLAELRPVKIKDERHKFLSELAAAAVAARKGKWSNDNPADHIRKIVWTVDNPREFVEAHKGKPIKAIIDYVRDGSTVRAIVLPNYTPITVMMSGIRSPTFKLGDGGAIVGAEPYAEEAKYFTECRLLQQDVEIWIESVSNQNFLGTIIHPNGDIAESLLREGFARCVDWTIGLVTGGSERLRAAERKAKERRLRLWKSYEAPAASADGPKVYQAKVTEIVLGDAMIVKKADGSSQKIWLSSVRSPRWEDLNVTRINQNGNRQVRPRPLYDIPFLFQAREFLRHKLVGKTVQYTVDYVQPASGQFPERVCCTVIINGQNVGEMLIAKGLATVFRHRQGDENRSSQYDQLLMAEQQAEKKGLGIHGAKSNGDMESSSGNKADKLIMRVQELQGNASKSKQFLPFLQRAGRSVGVVEFVAAGSRLRIYVPKESCLLTLLLGGINCPRPLRPVGSGGAEAPAEPFSTEAMQFTRDKCFQKEVEFEVDSVDKAGNFIGSCFVGGKNLAELLLEEGFGSVHFTADRSKYGNALRAAEKVAKENSRGVWSLPDYQQESQDEKDEEEEQNDSMSFGILPERVPDYRPVLVTDIQPNLRFFVQYFDQGEVLEKMMNDLRADMASSLSPTSSYEPKKGQLCAALFSCDKQWYRARVENIKSYDQFDVIYIDFGNRETRNATQLAPLPPAYANHPPGAKECALALVKLPPDIEYCAFAMRHFDDIVKDEQCMLNVEYRDGNIDYVTLLHNDTDVGKSLLRSGYCNVSPRRDRRLQSLITEYQQAEMEAKKERLNVWQYGDFTGTDL
ncbi:TUDOR and SNase domain containing protein [Trichuris trichiura]|uniref:Staphylococcal nuclease domain-containing protein 1 n=1 Tax=Trichuris trichiura TaxID=36087 RepID=A0A077ZC78_TRITR|nr:TUDOR and SNase domain containing protein [Trichuris trichiura]